MIRFFIGTVSLNCFDNINIWTNEGAHFRSKEFISFISSNIRPKTTGKLRYNVIGEHHGKSIVNGNFGQLSSIRKLAKGRQKIRNINELISLLTAEECKRAARANRQQPHQFAATQQTALLLAQNRVFSDPFIYEHTLILSSPNPQINVPNNPQP